MPTIDASNMGISFNSLGLPNVVEICPSRTPTRTPTVTPTATPTVTPEGVVDPPTVTQPPAITPEVLSCDTTTSTTINGYAYYFDHQQAVNIPGIGSLWSPCAGGHSCNRTDFIPQLITSSTTINGSPISLNNGNSGGDRSATFTFNIPDPSILSGTPAQIYLSCNGQYGCHNGVAWIVLTTTGYNGGTILLFNSCVVPNSLTPLGYTCFTPTPTPTQTNSQTPTATPTPTVTPTITQTNTVMPNSANFNSAADWDGFTNGNVTTVGSNGKPSFYGTYDQSGNLHQWNDLDGTTGSTRGYRGGYWGDNSNGMSSSSRYVFNSYYFYPSGEDFYIGFRLASLLNPLDLPNFVNVGDLGNVADTNTGSLYGVVGYNYKIGSFLVTNNEYVQFLKAVASNDISLYSTSMAGDRGGITRSGVDGSYDYGAKTNYGDKPVNFVSWFDCARYCNWLHNEKGSGSTETGAYNLSGAAPGQGPAKTVGAKYWIPTENEWYKAAYYKGGGTNAGYWNYATQSDTPPIPVCATPEGDGTPC